MRWLLFILAAAIGVGLDLGSKSAVFRNPELKAYGSRVPVINGWFDLALSENPGAAWGLLSGKHTFFIIISIVAFLAIIYFVHTAPKKARAGPVVLGLVFAGVAGNFFDRCTVGVVRDFIDWHTPDQGTVHDLFERVFGRTHWPTFNVADIFICTGAIAVVILFWREERRVRAVNASPAPAPEPPPPPAALPAPEPAK